MKRTREEWEAAVSDAVQECDWDEAIKILHQSYVFAGQADRLAIQQMMLPLLDQKLDLVASDEEKIKVLDRKLDLVASDEEKIKVLDRKLDLVASNEEKIKVLDRKLDLVAGNEEKIKVLDRKLDLVASDEEKIKVLQQKLTALRNMVQSDTTHNTKIETIAKLMPHLKPEVQKKLQEESDRATAALNRGQPSEGAGSERIHFCEMRSMAMIGRDMSDSVGATGGKDCAHPFLTDGGCVPNYPFADHVEETLFVRPPMKDLWQFLDKHIEHRESGTVIVQGAPGIGKTLAVWVWCLDYATRKRNAGNRDPRILFVRVKAPDVSYAILSDKHLKSGSIFAAGGFTCNQLSDVAVAVGQQLDLVVVDGLDAKSINVPLQLMNPTNNPQLLLAPKLIVSLSMQASLREESRFEPGSGLPYRQIRSFPGWKKEEYPACWRAEAKFSDWHYYAGSSIRLMWACSQMGEEVAKQAIDDAFGHVQSNDIKHLLRLTASPQNSTAVNRILVRDKELVSRYAFDKAWEQMHGDYAVWYQAFADRPQAIGWVYERQVLENIFLSHSPFARQVEDLGLETVVSKQTLAHPIAQTTEELKEALTEWARCPSPACGHTKWFIPRLGTFPNIDAAAVLARGTREDSDSLEVAVFGIQVTTSRRHDLDWSAYVSTKDSKEGAVKLCSIAGLVVAEVVHVSVSPHSTLEWDVKTKCDDVFSIACADTHICWRPDQMGDRQGAA